MGRLARWLGLLEAGSPSATRVERSPSYGVNCGHAEFGARFAPLSPSTLCIHASAIELSATRPRRGRV
jgi:hypothetical protein